MNYETISLMDYLNLYTDDVICYYSVKEKRVITSVINGLYDYMCKIAK